MDEVELARKLRSLKSMDEVEALADQLEPDPKYPIGTPIVFEDEAINGMIIESAVGRDYFHGDRRGVVTQYGELLSFDECASFKKYIPKEASAKSLLAGIDQIQKSLQRAIDEKSWTKVSESNDALYLLIYSEG